MQPWWLGAGGGLLCVVLGGFVSWLVRRHARALKTSEANFKAIFNQATVGIALADTQTGHLLQTNARCAHILGYTAQELATRTFQELVDPQDLSRPWPNGSVCSKGKFDEYRIEQRMRHEGWAHHLGRCKHLPHVAHRPGPHLPFGRVARHYRQAPNPRDAVPA